MLQVQEGEPGHSFHLQLFLKNPQDKRNKPDFYFFFCFLTFTEASFVFISLHSGSKSPFFFLPLITTPLPSKEFS